MKNQYQLKSLPYETVDKLNWAFENKKLVAVYEKLLINKKILYLLSIEKTEKEIAGITGQTKRRIEHLTGIMIKATGCKGKLGLIQIAYRLKIIN